MCVCVPNAVVVACVDVAIDEQTLQTAEFETDYHVRRKSSSDENVEEGASQQIPAITTSLALQDIDECEPSATLNQCSSNQQLQAQSFPETFASSDNSHAVSYAWPENCTPRRSLSDSSDMLPGDRGSQACESGKTSGKRTSLKLHLPAWNGFSVGAANGRHHTC